MTTVRDHIEAIFPGETFADDDTVRLERRTMLVGPPGSTPRLHAEALFPGEVLNDDDLVVVETAPLLVSDVVPDLLADDFSGTTLDRGKWPVFSDDVHLDGAGHLALPTTLNADNTAKTHLVTFASTRPLAGASARVEWERIALPAAGNSRFLTAAWLDSPTKNYVRAYQAANLLFLYVNTNGSGVSQHVAWDATNDRHWRLRDTGAAVALETSPDGGAWTQKLTTPRPSWIDADASYSVGQSVNGSNTSTTTTLVDSFSL